MNAARNMCLRIGRALLGSTFALGIMVSAEDSKLADAYPFEVAGIVFEGNFAMASLSEKASGRNRWVTMNEVIGPYVVKEITASSVVLRRGTESLRLHVRGANPIFSNEETPVRQAHAKYSAHWINSKLNPMLHEPQPLPSRVTSNWAKLSEDEKSAIAGYYEQHGWRLLVVHNAKGFSSFEWQDIFEKEREAAVRANRSNFEKSLTSEQLGEWKRIQSNVPIPIANGKPTEAQLNDAAARRDAYNKFLGQLSPQQREAIRNIPDFTTAWSDETQK